MECRLTGNVFWFGMRKSTLSLHLQKASKGEIGAVEKLLPLFAERLVFVPVVHEERSSGTTKVSVVTISSEKGPAVPAFTEEPLLRTWCTAQGRSHESLSLLGADLCAALASGKCILIDDLTDQRVLLSNELAAKVAVCELPVPAPSTEPVTKAPAAEPTPAPSPSEVSAVRIRERDIDDVSATVEVPEDIAEAIAQAQSKPASTTPPAPSFIETSEIRINPLTASSTRILRSPRPMEVEDPADAQPKKKSFLSFLSGRK